jgi:hypothetical protein
VFPTLCSCADHMLQLRLTSFETSAAATGERRERQGVCGRAGKLWKMRRRDGGEEAWAYIEVAEWEFSTIQSLAKV